MRAILTAVLIITASGASAGGKYVTTALPNGEIVITNTTDGKIRKCKWDLLSGSIQTGDIIMGYACSDWQSIKYSDD